MLYSRFFRRENGRDDRNPDLRASTDADSMFATAEELLSRLAFAAGVLIALSVVVVAAGHWLPLDPAMRARELVELAPVVAVVMLLAFGAYRVLHKSDKRS
ncbi:hypothetical protein LA345_40365 (plasmid) [Burkholderia vietnamiensis]|nr:hypothetical protein [Burkholderia vietnamiensis]